MTEVLKPAFDAALKSAKGPEAGAQNGAANFSDIVNNGRAVPPDTSPNLGNVVEKLITTQDAQLQSSVNDALEFAQQAPLMTASELNANAIRVTLQLSGMNLDLNAKMAVVDASKGAVETLMKNQ